MSQPNPGSTQPTATSQGTMSQTTSNTPTQRKLTEMNSGFGRQTNTRSTSDPLQKPLGEMTNDTTQAIRNISHAFKCLKLKGFIQPDGHQDFGLDEIITTLFQLSYFPAGETKAILNSVRSIAYYLMSIKENLSSGNLSKSGNTTQDSNGSSDSIDTSRNLMEYLSNATAAVKESTEVATKLVTDAKSISDHLATQNARLDGLAQELAENLEKKLGEVAEGLIERIENAATSAQTNVESTSKAIHDATTELSTAKKSYSQAVQSRPPPTPYTPTEFPFAGNPLEENTYMKEIRDKAKRAILDRQILIDPLDKTANGKKFMENTSLEAIKEKANSALKEMIAMDDVDVGENPFCFVGVKRLSNGGIVLELNDAEAAAILRNKDTQKQFVCRLDPDNSVTIKDREYQIIVFGAPISFDITSPASWCEIEEGNPYLDSESITRGRWVKPPHCRSPGQDKANAIIYFNSPESANKAILKGLLIHQRIISCERVRKEPLRCMKCQLYDHLVHECYAKDACSTCGKEHRSHECDNRQATFCVACNASNHCSWDRTCPSFLKKCEKLNSNLLENSRPFFPIESEPWTLVTVPPALPKRIRAQMIEQKIEEIEIGKERYRQTRIDEMMLRHRNETPGEFPTPHIPPDQPQIDARNDSAPRQPRPFPLHVHFDV